MEQNNNSVSFEIIKELRSCGHFLHYRTGGKTGRRRILLALSRHNNLLQRELQDILDVKSGSLSEVIINMESDGLIKKTKSEKDGRQFVLSLTDEGVRQAEISHKKYEEQVEKITRCLSDEQKYELSKLLKIITNHLHELEHDDDFSEEMTTANNKIKKKITSSVFT
ncbi:MAG: MarR family winged helix-turn-helix transcriptional regulator [Hominilimicola sp.]